MWIEEWCLVTSILKVEPARRQTHVGDGRGQDGTEGDGMGWTFHGGKQIIQWPSFPRCPKRLQLLIRDAPGVMDDFSDPSWHRRRFPSDPPNGRCHPRCLTLRPRSRSEPCIRAADKIIVSIHKATWKNCKNSKPCTTESTSIVFSRQMIDSALTRPCRASGRMWRSLFLPPASLPVVLKATS